MTDKNGCEETGPGNKSPPCHVERIIVYDMIKSQKGGE